MVLLICSILLLSSFTYSQDNTFEAFYNELPNCLSLDKDNGSGFLIASAGLLVTRIDSSGGILWKHTDENYGGGYVVLKNSPDESYIISRQNSDNSEMVVTKRKYSGETLWIKTFPGYKTGSIIVKPDGNLLISGYNRSLQKTMLEEYNPAGQSIWSKLYDVIMPLFGEKPPDIALNNSNIFLTSGQSLLKLDLNGNLISQVNYLSTITKIAPLQEGILIHLSHSTLRRYDNNNNLVWQIIAVRNFVYNPAHDRILVSSGFKADLLSSDGTLLFTLNNIANMEVALAGDGGFIMGGVLEYVIGGIFHKYTVQLIKTDFNLFHKGLAIQSLEKNMLFNIVPEGSILLLYRTKNISSPIILEYSRDNGFSWQLLSSEINPDSVEYLTEFPVFEEDSVLFRLRSTEKISRITAANISLGSMYDTINVNRINMWVGNNGDGSHDPGTDGNGFYWPDGIKSAIFEDGLVYAGKVNGEVRANGNTHRQGLRAGVILPDGTPDNPDKAVYSIRKLKYNWQNLPEGPEKQKYQYLYDNWPVNMGAPYKDVNNDGVYTQGVDEPGIGDETLFYVANDLDSNTTRFTYGSPPLGIEFQTTTFGFNQDNPLKDVVYKKYVLINKSNDLIEDMYLGYWSDPDLGDAHDDYSGVDSLYNLAYCYNANNNDGIYGSPPPAVGYRLVQGPMVAGNPNDSALFKGKWRKGYKNLRSTSFVTYFNVGVFRDPQQGVYAGTIELYNYLKGYRWDGDVIENPVSHTPTKFMLNGDPVAGSGWYMGDGWPGGPTPGDIRFLLSTGPFNLAPGDTQEVVIAIAAALGTSNKQSIQELRLTSMAADSWYNSLFTTITGIDDDVIPAEFSLSQNYPNPFNNSTVIKFSLAERNHVNLSVYDITGSRVALLVNSEMERGNHNVYFSKPELASGIYFYRLTANGRTFIKKMVLMK
jgi:hypothetical protein